MDMFSPTEGSVGDSSISSIQAYTEDYRMTDYNASTYDYAYGDYDPEEPCEMNTARGVEVVVGPYIHSVICILGLVGNCLVIITYAFYKRAKSMTDVYLLNVALADLLFVAALPLIIYNEAWDWTMGSMACKLLRGAYSVNLYCGMLLLACISTDRYVAIVQARRSFRLRSVFYGRVVCSAVWLLALALSFPTFYYYDTYQPSHLTMEMYEEHLYDEDMFTVVVPEEDYGEATAATTSSTAGPRTSDEAADEVGFVCGFTFQDNVTARHMKVLVPSTQMAVGFFLPLLVMVVCYSSVALTLLRTKNFQRHKAVRVVLAVVAVFVLCHLPYNLALLVDTATMFTQQPCGFVDNVQVAKTVTKTLAYLHCCLNPVLYAFVGVKFRNHFRKIVSDLWCLGKRYMSPRRFSRVTSDFYVSTIRRSVDGSSDNGSSFTM